MVLQSGHDVLHRSFYQILEAFSPGMGVGCHSGSVHELIVLKEWKKHPRGKDSYFLNGLATWMITEFSITKRKWWAVGFIWVHP